NICTIRLPHLHTACFDPSPGMRDYARFFLKKAGVFDVEAFLAEAQARLQSGAGKLMAYGANIRTNCMILLSINITDNLFVQ
ncbi:MAG: hypothetical protein GY792_16275, partial [Gammaproteobacteria bacterium]|nr:hypothetical protein [Gammaproteobacteria bacterium]